MFGEKVNELFIEAQLPEGWEKIATDYSMWSKLVDEQGRERASIFYKAAFYDQRAHMNITKRYSYCVQPVSGWDDPDYREKEWQCVVTDGGEVIWKSEMLEPEPEYDKDDRGTWLKWSDDKDALGKKGAAWLDENFPQWNDPVAYW